MISKKRKGKNKMMAALAVTVCLLAGGVTVWSTPEDVYAGEYSQDENRQPGGVNPVEENEGEDGKGSSDRETGLEDGKDTGSNLDESIAPCGERPVGEGGGN